jgi:hypothetical protein
MNNFYISFGIWLTVLPFLGLPGVWRNALVSLSGMFLLLVVLGPMIFKMLKPKGRPRKKKDNGASSLKV